MILFDAQNAIQWATKVRGHMLVVNQTLSHNQSIHTILVNTFTNFNDLYTNILSNILHIIQYSQSRPQMDRNVFAFGLRSTGVVLDKVWLCVFLAEFPNCFPAIH